MKNQIYSFLFILAAVINSSIMHTQEKKPLDDITQNQINESLVQDFQDMNQRISNLEKKLSDMSSHSLLNKDIKYKHLQKKPANLPCFNEEQIPFAQIVASSLALFNETKRSNSKNLPDIEEFVVATLQGKNPKISIKSQAESPSFLDPKFYNLLWHGKYWTPNSITIHYTVSQIRPGYIEVAITTEGCCNSINKDQKPAHCQFSKLLEDTQNSTYLVDEDMTSHPDDSSIQGESSGSCRWYGCNKTFRIFIKQSTFVSMVQQYNSSKYKQQ